MNGKAVKAVLSGTVMALGLGFGAKDAAADSFSVSVHTPSVSVGYGVSDRHGAGGYVDVYRPAPVVAYCPPPAPVVVYRPVVVHQPVHVCRYDSRPVTRYYVDDCGRRVRYTEYVRVRSCDGHHHQHGRVYQQYDNDYRHRHGNHGYRTEYRERGHDRDHDRGHYAKKWKHEDDDRHERRERGDD